MRLLVFTSLSCPEIFQFILGICNLENTEHPHPTLIVSWVFLWETSPSWFWVQAFWVGRLLHLQVATLDTSVNATLHSPGHSWSGCLTGANEMFNALGAFSLPCGSCERRSSRFSRSVRWGHEVWICGSHACSKDSSIERAFKGKLRNRQRTECRDA